MCYTFRLWLDDVSDTVIISWQIYKQYYYGHHIYAFLKPHLHCFANRSFLVTGSIGCISLASGCGVMTLTGTCVPLPVLFPQIKKREIL